MPQILVFGDQHNVRGMGQEAEIAHAIHNQVHYLELVAANKMGIIDEYVAWRPRESVTEEFYRKLREDKTSIAIQAEKPASPETFKPCYVPRRSEEVRNN